MGEGPGTGLRSRGNLHPFSPWCQGNLLEKFMSVSREAIEGLAFLGVGSADNSIFCRFLTGPSTTKFGGKLGNTVRVVDAKASGALQRLRFFFLPSLLGATAPSGHLQR
jgi:hypothetical protein